MTDNVKQIQLLADVDAAQDLSTERPSALISGDNVPVAEPPTAAAASAERETIAPSNLSPNEWREDRTADHLNDPDPTDPDRSLPSSAPHTTAGADERGTKAVAPDAPSAAKAHNPTPQPPSGIAKTSAPAPHQTAELGPVSPTDFKTVSQASRRQTPTQDSEEPLGLTAPEGRATKPQAPSQNDTASSTTAPADPQSGATGSADQTRQPPDDKDRTMLVPDHTGDMSPAAQFDAAAARGADDTIPSSTATEAESSVTGTAPAAEAEGEVSSLSDTHETHDATANNLADAAEERITMHLRDLLGGDADGALPLLSMAYGVFLPSEAEDRAAFWVAALAAAAEQAQQEPAKRSITGLLAAFLAGIVPMSEDRETRLRAAIARLGYAAPGTDTATRHRLRAALLPLVNGGEAAAQPAAPTPVEKANRSLTRVSGLVLFHPYIAMLFTRLQIAADKKGIAPDALPRALAALWWLVDGRDLPERPADPLMRCLLGQAPDTPLPDPATLTPDDTALIDGLITAVIGQWGRLGSTSPDGLRGAFIQRSGLLQEDDTTPQLIVEKAPYDMLIDSLPWSINLMALPWMPVALHVKWRGGDD